MIDIYKKLPKTNCGKCGVPTCMAFAVKVKNAQRKISDCPYITPEDMESSSLKPNVPYGYALAIGAILAFPESWWMVASG